MSRIVEIGESRRATRVYKKSGSERNGRTRPGKIEESLEGRIEGKVTEMLSGKRSRTSNSKSS
jgi:hypothetical protein